MDAVYAIIKEYQWRWPEFEYYLAIAAKAEKNIQVHPDISIEASKALIEGIGKTVITSLSDDVIDPKYFRNKDVDKILREALEYLSSYDDKFEDVFIKRAVSLIHLHGEIRNQRGDISHGQRAPKDFCSSADYAKLIFKVTEGLTEYILASFLKIERVVEDHAGDTADQYEQSAEFNQWLDEENPMPGGLSYSRALYDQDLIAYEAERESFEGDGE